MKSPPSDFDIPPTPARLGAVQRSNEICELLNEEEYISEGSLSTLTGEVIEAQRYQLSELDCKRVMLHDLEVELKRSQQMYQAVFNEVKAMNRQLYLLQDNVDETKKHCSTLENDIVNILKEKRELQSRLVNTRWNGTRHVITFEKYRKKMRTYQDTVIDYAKESAAHAEVKQVNGEIEELRAKLSNHNSEVENVDVGCNELRSEIKKLRERQTLVEGEMKSMELQGKKDKEHLFILKKENEAYQKRDAAKMKRLKVQLVETKRQNNEWRDQNNRLIRRLQEIRK